MMRKYITDIILFTISVLVFTGCEETLTDNYKEKIPSLSEESIAIYPSRSDISCITDTLFADIACKNSTWEIVDLPSWISVNPLNGTSGSTQIKIAVASNDSRARREGLIPIHHKGSSVNHIIYYSVIQEGNKPYLRFKDTESSYLSFDYQAQSVVLNIETNLDDLVVTSSASWCSAALDKSLVKLDIEKNASTSGRNALVTISSPSSNMSITKDVSQGSEAPSGKRETIQVKVGDTFILHSTEPESLYTVIWNWDTATIDLIDNTNPTCATFKAKEVTPSAGVIVQAKVKYMYGDPVFIGDIFDSWTIHIEGNNSDNSVIVNPYPDDKLVK